MTPVTELAMQLGELLTHWRESAGLSQAELGQGIAYDRTTVTHAEHGQIPAPEFWQACDELLQAQGALVELHAQWLATKEQCRQAAKARAREERRRRAGAPGPSLSVQTGDASGGIALPTGNDQAIIGPEYVEIPGLGWVHGPRLVRLVRAAGAMADSRTVAVASPLTGAASAGLEASAEDTGRLGARSEADDDDFAVADSPLATLTLAAELSGQDMRRRNFLAGSGFAVAAFAQPTLYAMTVPAVPVPAAESGRRVGMPDIETIHDTIRHFRRLDQSHGGGRLRVQVVGILHEEVAAAQRASYSEKVGRELFSALAEMTCLAAYMTLDAGRHALAQRYYVQALNLSRHAEDALLSGYVLSCMSFQATYLGHARDGVALAAAAQLRAGDRAMPGATAMFKALEARAHALLGDEAASAAALAAAEHQLGRSLPGDGPPWLTYFTSAELAAHTASCLRDLGKPAAGVEPQVACALDAYDPVCVRSRGFAHIVLATAHLAAPPAIDVEAACGAADKALDIAGRVRSARVREHLADFLQRLQPYHAEPAAREFAERARPVLDPGTMGASA
jgi:hypothetical protein